jgi:hypothetical protein
MHTPPDPGIPAILLAIAHRFGFVAIDTSGLVGGIQDHTLTVESAGQGSVAWLVLSETETKDAGGLAPRYLTREAYDALREGSLDKTGCLESGGQRYRILDRWDGKRLVATLSLV